MLALCALALLASTALCATPSGSPRRDIVVFNPSGRPLQVVLDKPNPDEP